MLTEVDLGHLRYFRNLVNQPVDEWKGFYRSPADGMNFGLRFQLAFPVYALYAMAQQTPAYTAPYAQIVQAYIDKMLYRDSWAYWFYGVVHSQKESKATALQTVVNAAHSRLGIVDNVPLTPDPCRTGNIQYSGHLSSMLGFYQLLSGDSQFDRVGFILSNTNDEQTYNYHYTYTDLAAHIYEQMHDNYFGGVCCEPGRAYAACNNHACISNLLHDKLYGTDFAEVNANWANWVATKMLRSTTLPLPTPNGLLSVAYMPQLHLPIPVSFNFTDAWGFAFMAAWWSDLVEQVYPRFRKRLKPARQGLKLTSFGINENMEISNEGLNTAFALVLARTMSDHDTANALQQHLDAAFDPAPTDDPLGRYYSKAKPSPYITALVALAKAMPTNGLKGWLDWQPDFTRPHITAISPALDVTRAELLPDGICLLTRFAKPTTQTTQIELAQCPSTPSLIKSNHSAVTPDNIIFDLANKKVVITLKAGVNQLEVIF